MTEARMILQARPLGSVEVSFLPLLVALLLSGKAEGMTPGGAKRMTDNAAGRQKRPSLPG